jgi:hypothetical protein
MWKGTGGKNRKEAETTIFETDRREKEEEGFSFI